MVSKFSGKYVVFVDKEGGNIAGYVYKVDGDRLQIHTVKKNSRNILKTYYYTIKESDVLKVISKQEAIDYVNK